MIKRSLLILALVIGARAQNPNDQKFSTTDKETSLSTAAAVLTVQHNAGAQKQVVFATGYIYCSVSCNVTLEHSGTAASTTAGTIININPNNVFVQTTQCTAYTASNVGTGSVLNTYYLSAGGWLSLNLSDFILPGGVADNLTLRTNAITGAAQLQFTWREQ